MDSNWRASLSFLCLWASKSVCSFYLVCGCYLVFEDLQDFCEVEDFLFFFKSFKRKVRWNESCSSIRCSFGWKVFFSGAYQTCATFLFAHSKVLVGFSRLLWTRTLYYSLVAWRHGAETCEIILNKIHSETPTASSRRRRSANNNFFTEPLRSRIVLLTPWRCSKIRAQKGIVFGYNAQLKSNVCSSKGWSVLCSLCESKSTKKVVRKQIAKSARAFRFAFRQSTWNGARYGGSPPVW